MYNQDLICRPCEASFKYKVKKSKSSDGSQVLIFLLQEYSWVCGGHACNPSNSGGDQEDHSLRSPWAKS
jgi:hypothetical protein